VTNYAPKIEIRQETNSPPGSQCQPTFLPRRLPASDSVIRLMRVTGLGQLHRVIVSGWGNCAQNPGKCGIEGRERSGDVVAGG